MDPICFYVLIPVYNTEKYIDACLLSVLGQTYQNFQIVIVDDGSPDNAGEICERYAENDSRIHVLHQKNTGLICARRTAVRYALDNGAPDDYCLFLDSDDTYTADCLQTVFDAVQASNSDLVIFGMDNVYNGKVLSRFDTQRAFLGCITDKRELYNTVFLDGWYNPLCRKAVKLSLIRDEDYSAFYGMNTSEDLLQSIQLYRDCNKVNFIEQSLYNYNYNPYSITNSVDPARYKVNSSVLQKVKEFLKSENVWTASDFEHYAVWCRTLTRLEIITILKFLIPRKQKYAFLDTLRKDPYYSCILSSAPKTDILLCIVRERFYFLPCIVGSFIKRLGNLRKVIRRWRALCNG